jgi:two-component system sensor histidine kinase FlrB
MKNASMQAGMDMPPGVAKRAEIRGFSDALDTLLGMARRGWAKTRARATTPAAVLADRAESERLRAAFDAFNCAAAHLEGSYSELRAQVERLSDQLAHANGELERQLVEKQALAERQSALLAALPAGVVVIGPCGTVREANSAAMQLLGTALIGASWQEVAARFTPADCEFEWIVPNASQQRIGLEEQSLGSERGRIVLLHDVTEVHAARDRLARNERLAAMGEMAARLAHQLRTPLATAMLYASQLERPGMSEAEREAVAQRVLSRLRNLERVTREMLRFVRGERASAADIDVGILMGETAQVIEPLMANRGIAFAWEDHTGGAVLHGDRRGLAAALVSLLENAAQATPQGGKVRLEGMANSKQVRICVSDTGTGIPRSAFERVFEPFYSTRSDGTGLGLAIVKTVVELHGGTVDITSSADSGTQFTIILPRDKGCAPMALLPPAVAGSKSSAAADAAGAQLGLRHLEQAAA